MKVTENQKVIIVCKETADREHPYSIINLEAINKMASALMTVTSVKLWIYIAKNQNKYNFALSRIDFCRWASCSKPSYLKAVEDLIDKGFLVQKENNTYLFFENPQDGINETAEDINIEIPKNKKAEMDSFIF